MRFSAKSSALWRQVIVKTGLTLGVVSAVGLSARNCSRRGATRPWLSLCVLGVTRCAIRPAARGGRRREA
ncbi:MAG: hypothetical protein MZV49_11780 [Rhodopseudomonas palustris]|nr:hypothetical protein [Rhodopseudomonas palustris]